MYRAKEITKKVFNDKNEFNKVIKQNEYIFINSENSKTFDPHRLLLNLLNKTNLKRSENMLLYQTLAFTIHEKIRKSHTKIMNLKCQLEHGMKKLNYLMDQILYQIFDIILNIYEKNMRQLLIILQ